MWLALFILIIFIGVGFIITENRLKALEYEVAELRREIDYGKRI